MLIAYSNSNVAGLQMAVQQTSTLVTEQKPVPVPCTSEQDSKRHKHLTLKETNHIVRQGRMQQAHEYSNTEIRSFHNNKAARWHYQRWGDLKDC